MIGLLNCPIYNKLLNNKLSNNKLSDNNFASELVENRTFLIKPITSEEIVIFMITVEINVIKTVCNEKK